MSPLLTLAIPTYNRAPTLDRLLCIIQPQLENHKDDIEFIISDNCSPDNTQEAVKHYIDAGMPICYIRNEHNVGPSENIINCYKMAKGKYIWVLGDDDYLSDDALSYVLSIIKNNKDYGLLWISAAHLDIYANKDKKLSMITGHEEYLSKKDFFSNINFLIILISTSILKKSYVEKFPFDEYVNGHTLNWQASAILNTHVMLEAEYNVLIHKNLLPTLGVGKKSSGGYNIIKVLLESYLMRKQYRKQLKIRNKYNEIDKRVLFFGLLGNVMENIFFGKEIHDYNLEQSWLFLFKFFWYEPYFYKRIIRCILKHKIKFIKKNNQIFRLLLKSNNSIWQKIGQIFDPLTLKKERWRYINPHNETIQALDFDYNHVFAGVKTTGELWVFDDQRADSILRIGNYCVIGQNVHFLLNDSGLNSANFKGNIIVGNNVQIGRDVIVYPGVNIGNNAVVLGGSVVTENIPNNKTVYGNPAKPAKIS